MADIVTTLKVLITAQNQTNAAFSQMNGDLNKLKQQIVGVVASLAGGLAFRDMIDATRQWGNEVDTLRDQLGGTAEQMSALNFIGQSVGLTTEELGQTFGILNKRIADSLPEIAKGTSEFDKWGISLKDSNGNIVNFDEAMRRIKTRFQEVGQGAQGTALLLDIFGRTGKSLSDFLALTDDQMKLMIQDAENFGLILNGQATDALERFNRDIYRLQLQFQGLKVQLGLFLLPLLSALISSISRGLGFIKQLGEAVGRMLGPFKEWIDKLGGVKGIGDALLFVGVALLGLAVLGGMIGLLTWLGSFILMAAPLVAVAAGLALVGAGLVTIADAALNTEDPLKRVTEGMSGVGVVLAGLALILLPFSVTAAVVAAAIALVSFAIAQVSETLTLVTSNWDLFVKALKEGKLNDIPVFGLFFHIAADIIKKIEEIQSAWTDLQRALAGAGPPGHTQHQSPDAQDRTNPPQETPTPPFPGGNLLFPPHGIKAAAGGIALARPGGTRVTVGEGGQDEAIIPLGRGGGMGATINNYFNIAGSLLTEDGLVDTLNDRLMGKLFSQRKLSF